MIAISICENSFLQKSIISPQISINLASISDKTKITPKRTRLSVTIGSRRDRLGVKFQLVHLIA